MDIRHTLNEHPTWKFVVVGVGLLMIVLMGFIAFSDWSGSESNAGKDYFTIDDGKTWFADNAAKIPPFMHDGKPAYRVYLWTYNGGKDVYPSHLERYSPEAKQKLEDARSRGKGDDPALLNTILLGIEVKETGNGDVAKNWVKRSDPAAFKITGVNAPKGTSGNPEAVLPR